MNSITQKRFKLKSLLALSAPLVFGSLFWSFQENTLAKGPAQMEVPETEENTFTRFRAADQDCSPLLSRTFTPTPLEVQPIMTVIEGEPDVTSDFELLVTEHGEVRKLRWRKNGRQRDFSTPELEKGVCLIRKKGLDVVSMRVTNVKDATATLNLRLLRDGMAKPATFKEYAMGLEKNVEGKWEVNSLDGEEVLVKKVWLHLNKFLWLNTGVERLEIVD